MKVIMKVRVVEEMDSRPQREQRDDELVAAVVPYWSKGITLLWLWATLVTAAIIYAL
jgi:hypothetical protein